MNKQDVLPTWEWAFSKQGLLSAKWDFDEAFQGGNSIKVSGNLPANTPIDLMLYKTKIPVSSDTGMSIVTVFFKNAVPSDSKMKLILVFADDVTQKYEFPLSGTIAPNNWLFQETALMQYAGREIAMIGLRFASETTIPDYAVNIGVLAVLDFQLSTIEQNKKSNFVTVSYPENNNVNFTINWPSASRINYTITDLQGKIVKKAAVELNKTTNCILNTAGWAVGTYFAAFSDKNNVTETKKIIIR